MCAWSFTPKTWAKFAKTMSEHTRAELNCLHCGGLVKHAQKGNQKKQRHPPLKGCSVQRLTRQPDAWIIAWYSRLAEHFDLHVRGKKSGVALNFVKRSLKCTLVHRHQRVEPVTAKWGHHFGFPMPNEQRPRILQSDQPFRPWPCVRTQGCQWRKQRQQEEQQEDASTQNNNDDNDDDDQTSNRLTRKKTTKILNLVTEKESSSSSLPGIDLDATHSHDNRGPPPLLIAYWMLRDTKHAKITSKTALLMKQHPGLQKRTVDRVLQQMHQQQLIVRGPSSLTFKSLSKRWLQVRLPTIRATLRQYNEQREETLKELEAKKTEMEKKDIQFVPTPPPKPGANKAQGHYQRWRNAQWRTGLSNADLRAKYLELFPAKAPQARIHTHTRLCNQRQEAQPLFSTATTVQFTCLRASSLEPGRRFGMTSFECRGLN